MFVEIVLTFMAFLGLIIYYWCDIWNMTMEIKGRWRLYIHGFKAPHIRVNNGDRRMGIVDGVGKLLQATTGLGTRKSAYIFMICSLSASMMIFAILKGRVHSSYVFTAALLTLILPTAILAGRLQTIRIKSSREGISLLTELCDNYKINYFNMQQAIEITAFNIKEAPNSKRLLFNLAKGLNTASQPEEIRRMLDDFSFAIGTSWSEILAGNMYFSLVSGIRVTEAMEDLIVTLAKARQVEEYAKRENNEGGLILKYMAPVCYVLTVVGGVRYFGLTAEEFIEYQFFTSAGLSWFLISLFIYILGILLRMFLSRSKLDL